MNEYTSIVMSSKAAAKRPTMQSSRYIELDEFPPTSMMEKPLAIVDQYLKADHTRHMFNTAITLSISGALRIKFDSLMEARTAADFLQSQGFKLHFISQLEYARSKFQNLDALNLQEGLVDITIAMLPGYPDAASRVDDFAQSVCQQYGQILSRTPLGVKQQTRTLEFSFRVEFDSVDAAHRATKGLVDGAAFDYKSSTKKFKVQFIRCEFPSPGAGRVQNIAPVQAPPKPQTQQFNQVKAERIQDGSDIRTTIMIRNVPNRMDQLELKQLLDEHCFGRYDFMYLRIDFETGCNVGYAFVNFVDTPAILDFAKNTQGLRWPAWLAQKPAEISYATIQGKESLIAKFRNSSIMTEAAYVQPRTMFTWLDHGAFDSQLSFKSKLSTFAAFPAADNPTKLERSIAGGRLAGLFTANATNAGSSTALTRRRTGLYDNGNPRQQAPLSTRPGNNDEVIMKLIEVSWAACQGFEFEPYNRIPVSFVASFLEHCLPVLEKSNILRL